MKVSQLRLPVKRGDRGEQVQVVQKAVGVVPDGDFGPMTENAVKIFQRQQGLKMDGIVGPQTAARLDSVNAARGYPEPPPPKPASGVATGARPDSGSGTARPVIPWQLKPCPAGVVMDRVIMHWNAGTYTAQDLDKKHYHVLIQGDNKIVKGNYDVPVNGRKVSNGSPAALSRCNHTKNCNTGSAAVSVLSMGGAVESPFQAGKWPMKRQQYELLPFVVADLFVFYKIGNLAVTSKNCLSHAEVQRELGIKQDGKWDIARLAFDPNNQNLNSSKEIGDDLRERVRRRIDVLMR